MISVALLDSKERDTENLRNILHLYEYININGIYRTPLEALLNIEKNPPDALFLEVDLIEMSGIDFVRNIKNMSPKIEIIFTTGLVVAAVEAFEVNALDFIVKPVTHIRLDIALQKLQERIFSSNHFNEYVCKIQCFGKFELLKISVNYTRNLKWRTKKVKELFAYLLSNYTKSVNKDELTTIIYDGIDRKKAQNNLYVTMSYLRRQLAELGIDRDILLIKSDYSIEIKKGVCDFVDFDRYFKHFFVVDNENVEEVEEHLNLYQGMFLEEEEYLWAGEIRHYADIKYEHILLSLASYYKETKQFRLAEKSLVRILANNQVSLQAMTQLLELYIEYKKYDSFIKQYQIYNQVIREEFDELSEKKYTNYYQSIMNDYHNMKKNKNKKM